jgi:thioredoxin 1
MKADANSPVVTLSDGSFDKEIVQSDVPALVDFGATWCAPCRALAPTVAALAADYKGRLKVGTIDIDDNAEIAAKYAIRSVPTMLFFKGGQVVAQLVGAMPRSRIEAEIRKLV